MMRHNSHRYAFIKAKRSNKPTATIGQCYVYSQTSWMCGVQLKHRRVGQGHMHKPSLVH